MWEAPVAYPNNVDVSGTGENYIVDWDEENLRWWARNNDSTIYSYWNPTDSSWNSYTP